MIRIGANPIGWSNDDLPEIGAQTSLETCLAQAREAGIVGMEKGHKMPNDGAALKAKLAQFDHVFVGGWYSTHLLTRSVTEELEAAKALIAMTRDAGAEVIILAECSNTIHGDRTKPLSHRPVLSKAEWVSFGAKLTEIAHRLTDLGLRPCYHHHMGTVVQTEADIDRLMANTKPPLHLLLETGHARWGGADPAGLARAYWPRIGHVHCKDVRERQLRQSHIEDWSFLDSVLGKGDDLGVYTVPGDGIVDYTAVFKALKGYSGWVVMEAEQDPLKAPSLAYAKRGVAHLKAALDQAGLA